MKILCLYANECAEELWNWLKEQGHIVIRYKERLNEIWCKEQSFDLSVSYTYPYIIKQNIIDALDGNIVNLHTSYLPFNRGSYPNVWSIIDGTPRGVTLHYIDAGVDSGDIISQVLVPLRSNESLRSSYNQLDKEAKELFKKSFLYYDYWNLMRKKPVCKGNYHTDKDFYELIKSDQFQEWNMSIIEFEKKISEKDTGGSI